MADVVRYATRKSMTTHSSTNGISVTKEILDSLKAARLTTLAFNFWGIGDRHDQEVGVAGAYIKLLENFKYSISIGLSYFMNHVTTRKALQSGDTFRLMDLAFELGCKGITLVDPCAYDESSDILLTAKEFTIINDTVRKKGIASRVNKCANRLWTAPSCGAASERIFVTAFGDVCPCDYIPISFGNIRIEPLKEIMNRMQGFSDHFTCAGCIAGRSKIFVEKYIAPIYQSGEVPVHYLKHPMFKKSTGAT